MGLGDYYTVRACVCVCMSLFEILSKVTDFVTLTYKNIIISVRLSKTIMDPKLI
jgi:hypothetical protein